MKKFLVFAIICIVVASLGLLTYNFLSVSETILIEQTTYYVNIDKDFKINFERQNPKSSTVYSLEVDSAFADLVTKSPIEDNTFHAVGAGQAIIRFTSNIPGFTAVTITVNIGNGTENAPYYIADETDLLAIGTENGYEADKNFLLQSDIVVPEEINWIPLCNTEAGFTGKFDFNGHFISGVTVNSNSAEVKNAGLFAKLGSGAEVNNAKLINTNLVGTFENAGALAGVNEGTITKAYVEGITINNTNTATSNNGGLVGYSTGLIQRSQVVGASDKASSVYATGNANSGGLVGYVETTSKTNTATVLRSNTVRVHVGGKNAGGLIGLAVGSEIRDVYARAGKVETTLTENAYVGGLVGELKYVVLNGEYIGATLLNGYSATKVVASTGITADALVGNNNAYSDQTNLYYVNFIVGLYYFTDETTITTNLTNTADYIYVTELQSNSDVTVDETNFTFKTKANTTDVKQFSLIKFDTENVWNIVNGEYPTLNYEGLNSQTTILRTDATPLYTITTLVETLTNKPTDNFILGGDIDGNGARVNAINSFAGTLDGKGYTIKNVTFITTTGKASGLFEKLTTTAKVFDINFENITIESAEYVGVIAGINEGTIENVTFSSCTLTAGNTNLAIGGVAGLSSGNIKNVVVKATKINVNANNKISSAGFIVGENANKLENAVVVAQDSQIKINANVNIYVGGIAGTNSSKLNNSIKNIEVGYGYDKTNGGISEQNALVYSAKENDKTIVGGLVGHNKGDITSCKVSGYIHAYLTAGLVGKNEITDTSLDVAQCFASNNLVITAHQAGGLVGQFNSGTVRNSSTECTIFGFDSKSTITGFAFEMLYHEVNNSTITHCFSATVLSDKGTPNRYFETSLEEARSPYPWMDVAVITKSPFDKEVSAGATSSAAPEDWQEAIFNTGIFGEYESDIDLSTTDCKDPSNSAFNEFDKSIWNLTLGNYPRPNETELQTVVNNLVGNN